MLSRAFYRTRQFVSALRPRITDSERDAARSALGDSLYLLFESMSPTDQRHCLDVFEEVLRNGGADTGMLRAALIHDCGKGDLAGTRIGLADRVAFVLLSPFPPVLDAASRRRGIAAMIAHPEVTLDLARQYGADEDVVRLVEEMESARPSSQRARALKRADDLN